MNSTSGNPGADTSSGVLDWFKWLIVTALAAAGVYGNWFFRDESLLYRVLALVAIGIVAVLIALTTRTGGATWSLMKDARAEIRKVVWPTRTETNQTTMIVLLLVVLFALLLWGLDSLLSWIVASVIG